MAASTSLGDFETDDPNMFVSCFPHEFTLSDEPFNFTGQPADSSSSGTSVTSSSSASEVDPFPFQCICSSPELYLYKNKLSLFPNPRWPKYPQALTHLPSLPLFDDLIDDEELSTTVISLRSKGDKFIKSPHVSGFFGFIRDRSKKPKEKYYYPCNATDIGKSQAPRYLPVLITHGSLFQPSDKDIGESNPNRWVQILLRYISKELLSEQNVELLNILVLFPYNTFMKHASVDANTQCLVFDLHPLFHYLSHPKSPLNGYLPYYTAVDLEELQPIPKKEREELRTGSSVKVYGYPSPVSSHQPHFLPMARFGHCAGNPWIVGRDQFPVDIASYPGQEGAPVYFFGETLEYDTIAKKYVWKNESRLVGISAPTEHTIPVKELKIPIHLGQVVKIDCLQSLLQEISNRHSLQ